MADKAASENPNVGVPGGALDQNTNATTPEAAGPPIETASREELAKSGYSLPEGHFADAKAGAGAPENKSLTPSTENKTQFASSAASDAAAEAGLTDADFANVTGSGAGGSLTKADVQGVIDSKQS